MTDLDSGPDPTIDHVRLPLSVSLVSRRSLSRSPFLPLPYEEETIQKTSDPFVVKPTLDWGVTIYKTEEDDVNLVTDEDIHVLPQGPGNLRD